MSRDNRAVRRVIPVDGSRSRTACLATVGVVGAALALALAPAAGAHDGIPALPVIAGKKAATPARTLTLVTGDKLQVTTDSQEKLSVVALPRPGRPAPALNVVTSDDGHVHVTPEPAEPLIAAGRLDPALFDVTQLLTFDFDDKASPDIPLIATYGKNTKSFATPDGARKVRRLDRLRTATFRTDKSDADTFWNGIRSGARLADGMTKLWLDKPVKATDVDWNVSRIQAPDAWAAGLDGKGVPVAVLDTGVDSTHPDLAGRIKETKNFTEEADAVDGHGHGTHVAATIAGSGTASDGQHKGVAPAADLYIGKVLDNAGQGTDSEVLAGMDWAAHSGAKIVSMSLGGAGGADGTDPLSQAVNSLSAETGTLFVIAAGNSGSGPDTVGAPGSAADALTVGAVDADGRIAGFSSRGPLKDGRFKPDVTAPGVNIVSARATGTSMGHPVDDRYTAADGTSMATPHVAGAAAIVAQAHPDWTGQQIKAALVGTAEPGQEGVFTDGSGEIRAKRATDAKVLASPATLNFPVVNAEQTDTPSREVTYTNTTESPVTLNLAADFTVGGQPAADGTFTLSESRVTLPARGTATVTLTLDASKASSGTYSGAVTATADGGITVRTPSAVLKDIPRATVDLPVTRHDGGHDAIGGKIQVFAEDKGGKNSDYVITPGRQPRLRLEPGHYTIIAQLLGHNSSGTVVERSLVGDTNIAAKAGETVTVPLDASKARKVDLRGERTGEVRYREFGWYRSIFDPDSSARFASSRFIIPDQWNENVYLGALSAGSRGSFQWSERATWYRQDVNARIIGGPGFAPQPVWGAPAARGEHRYRVVPVGRATATDLAGKNLKGAIALLDTIPDTTYAAQTSALKAAGAAAVLISGPDNTLYQDMQFTSTLPAYTVTKAEADRLRRTHTWVSIDYAPDSPYLYDLVIGGQNSGTDKVTHTAKDTEMARYDADYHSTSGGTMLGNTARLAAYGSVVRTNGYAEQIQLPFKRTEFLMPDTRWTRMMVFSHVGGTKVNNTLQPADTSPKPGARSHEDWLRPGIAPFVGNGVVTRLSPTMLRINARTWGDSSGSHFAGPNNGADVVNTKWYRNDELVGGGPAFEIFGLPTVAESANYRLETEARRENQPTWGYSTHVATTWAFKADASTEPDLPAPRYDIPTDGYGKVSGGKDLQFTLATGNHPTSAELSYSVDAGTTWKKANVTHRADGAWAVTLRLPKAKDTEDSKVSLRLRAANDAGDTVAQTVTDAFGLR
ncbi:S8 family serine peptidase [Streptomyces sp. NPDC050400]|uniref:S8 family serine peptidase n=1 Tax=Streptomyces sp. NPDC050400 TaxID=3365610 RepID=UPI0037A7E7FD